MDRLYPRSLHSDEIRLVEVIPLPETAVYTYAEDLPLELKLRVFHASKAPRYTALSYTWGSSEEVASVFVNGAGFSITHNLYCALEQFRLDISDGTADHSKAYDAMSPDGADSWPSHFIWVDALSINQLDEMEKSCQVAHMSAIYRNSTCVMAYLGDDEPDDDVDSRTSRVDSSPALAKIHAVVEKYHAMAPSSRSFADIPEWASEAFADDFCVCGDETDDALWRAVQALFAKPWWSRIWVAHEMMSGRPTWIVHGHVRLDFDDVLVFAALMAMVRLHPNDSAFAVYGISPFVYEIKDILEQHRMSDVHTPQLLDVLMSYRYFGATDPRDKVYAALGMMQPNSIKGLMPDYSKDLLRVYTDVVKAHVRSSDYSSKLDFLGSDGLQEGGITGLPSWLPDWRHQSQYQVPFRKYSGDMAKIPRPKQLHRGLVRAAYSASGTRRDLEDLGISPRQLVGFSGRSLHVKGYRLGYLYDLQSAFQPGDSQQVINGWRDSIGMEPYFTGESEMEAFSKLLVAGLELSRHEAFCRTPLIEEPTASLSAMSRHKFQPPAFSGIRIACAGRKMARVVQKDWTSDGLALVPECAREGDQVFVLFGGQVLYILRPAAGGGYRFVGEAYVHGLMDGEVLDLLKQGLAAVQEIVIR
ncbi:Heterokaryon incompatibility protein (HET) [Ceratocystis lukuohia]|uniref:Heterokaryon incompatibility protein (HET) n=1 Tax=Ceratocystis lukuohia TaxID=2019550 RepID=A0ABR4M959_9PEZI